MTEREQIEKLYHDMYRAMVAKDRAELERTLAVDFVLVHMTGMRQSRDEYIGSIMDGTLNYYSEKTELLDISIRDDRAHMTGHSRVCAAVFGGGRAVWKLALDFDLKREDGAWSFTRAGASTY